MVDEAAFVAPEMRPPLGRGEACGRFDGFVALQEFAYRQREKNVGYAPVP
ncbi:MAG: hypothetical protein WBD71_12065 [Xanthobacteraceae bacterium]